MNGLGSLGNVYGVQDPSQLPEWLRRQYQQMGGGSEGGNSYWSLGGGPNGSFKDSQGRDVIQIGQSLDEINKRPENGKYFDPSKIWEDPELGYVTSPDNFQGADLVPFYKDPMFYTFLSMVGAGAGLGAFGGEAAAGGAGMEGGAFDMGGSAGFGGSTPLASQLPESYWSALAQNGASDAAGEGAFGELSGGDFPYGTEMPNTYAPGADPTSSFGIGENYYTPGMGQGLNSQSWIERLLGPLANPSQLPEWAAENPLSALRAGAGIASLIGAARGSGGGSSGGGGGGGSVPWNGPLPQLNIQQGQFQQNPYLNFNVPFMGRM